MVKHLYIIFLFIFLYLGMIAISQEEQSGSRTYAESPEENPIGLVSSDYSFCVPSDCILPDSSHSLFNNKNRDSGISDALCPVNPYSHKPISLKSLKLKLNLPAGQSQHLLTGYLRSEQNPSLSFTPSAFRYSCGYYIYGLAHILI